MAGMDPLLLRGAVNDFRRTWPQLLLTDLAAGDDTFTVAIIFPDSSQMTWNRLNVAREVLPV